MTTYFATFIPGFAEVILDVVKKDFPDILLIHIFESSILFRTNKTYKQVALKSYFNNVFISLHFYEITKEQLDESIVKELFSNSDIRKLKSSYSIRDNKTFRLMIQKGSKLINIPSKIRKQIISSIIEETNWRFNPLKAEIEFWFLIRNEKCALLGIKTSQIKSTPYQKLKKGELRPKTAHILNLISEPNSTDIYLDPFAGYGALPCDRVNYFPYKKVYISEVDTKLCDNLDSSFKNNKRITIQQSSALNLSFLSDKSVNKIVTDPPWGIYQMQNIDYEKFYEDMLNEMIRITQSGGLLIILTAKLKEIENAIDSLSEKLSLLKTYNILVNGKKANVYKIRVH